MSESTGRILVVRHGETEWSRAGRHTGRSDLPLTAGGEAAARALAPIVAPWRDAVTWCSPLQRARRTAELAGLTPTPDPDLAEWDYGVFEGRTTAEIRESTGDPEWSVWTATDGLGESLDDVRQRVQRVLDRARPLLLDGTDVVLAAHAHLLRILAVTWIELPPDTAKHVMLDAAGTGILGYDRGTPVLERWNA